MNIKERISQFENNDRITLETEQRNILDQRHIKRDQEIREFNELRQVVNMLEVEKLFGQINNDFLENKGKINSAKETRKYGETNDVEFRQWESPKITMSIETMWETYCPSYDDYSVYIDGHRIPASIGIKSFVIQFRVSHVLDKINICLNSEINEKTLITTKTNRCRGDSLKSHSENDISFIDIDNKKNEIKSEFENSLASILFENKKFQILPLSGLIAKERENIFKAITEGELAISELPKDWILTNKEKEICQTRININRERQIQRQNEAKDNRNWFEKLVG